jgi:TonB-linked SusC/RagA family outer membrane protein
MKVSLLLSLFALIFISDVLAQDITVTGRVTIIGSGDALPLVNIRVDGTLRGTVSDANGDYRIVMQPGENILIFSYTGFITARIDVDGRNRIDVALSPQISNLNDVVVTAFGIEREKRALGYTVQDVGSADIARTGSNNLIDALQGQVAGVQISRGGGGAGQGSQIFIRGLNSIDPTADNQPLFVVDGVPIDNTTVESFGRVRGMSNRAMDLNPDDIASISVLRSAPAVALYGVRAANGAVIITTKQGSPGEVQVNFTHSISRDDVINRPDYQDVYGQGFAFQYDPTNSVFGAWGAKHDDIRATNPDAAYYNNWKNAMQVGTSVNNAINISGGSQNTTFYTSLSDSRNRGVIPNNDWKRTSVRLSGQATRGAMNFGASANIINSGGNRVPFVNFMERLSYWSTNADVTDWRFDDGRHKSSVAGAAGPGTGGGRNPVYDAYTNTYQDDVNRLIGNLNLGYVFTDWLTVEYRLGMDTYIDERTEVEPGPLGIANEFVWSLVNGFRDEVRLSSRDLSSNVSLLLKQKPNDNITIESRFGSDIFDRETNLVRAYGESFNVPGFSHLSNAATVRVAQQQTQRRLVGVYGDISADWQNIAYLNITGRNDWTSTLDKDNRSFFYPSVSTGFVFSDLVDLPEYVTYGKLRASFAQVGKDAPPYSLTSVYVSPTEYPIDGLRGFTRSPRLASPGLKPERTSSSEIGLDVRFFENRIGIDMSVYKSNSKDMIIPVPVSNATGYSVLTTNAGEIENRGVELTLKAEPVNRGDFIWMLTSNFTKNRNEVISIREGVDAIFLGDIAAYLNRPFMQLVPGQSYGAIWGSSYARYYGPGESPKNPRVLEKDRPVLIGANGFPVIDTQAKIVGDATPDWSMNMNNQWVYRNWDLNVNLDLVMGIDKYNKLDQWDSAFGHTTKTLNREDHVVFDGLTANGTRNTKEVWLGQGVDPKTGIDYGAGYHRNVYRAAVEQSVEDASYLKIRSLSVGYMLSKADVEQLPIQSLKVSLMANNILLWTPFSQYDPEAFVSSGSNLIGLVDLAYPGTRSLMLSLNLSF